MSDTNRTYRERRLARAARLREWAAKREARSEAEYARAGEMGAAIPFGQPMLTDHYSYRRDLNYRARIGRAMDRSVEHARKAAEMSSKAANIEAAADRAIYSDDPDAIERLEVKLADLEAQRARIKAYNASCRKGARDLSLLDEKQRTDILRIAQVAAFQIGPKGEFPKYALSNLSGTISTTRKRLESLRDPS